MIKTFPQHGEGGRTAPTPRPTSPLTLKEVADAFGTSDRFGPLVTLSQAAELAHLAPSIDGRIFPVSLTPKKKEDELSFKDMWFPIQVKQKDKAGRPDIDSFETMMMREDRQQGFFVAFDF